jgi:hypothetical protein
MQDPEGRGWTTIEHIGKSSGEAMKEIEFETVDRPRPRADVVRWKKIADALRALESGKALSMKIPGTQPGDGERFRSALTRGLKNQGLDVSTSIRDGMMVVWLKEDGEEDAAAADHADDDEGSSGAMPINPTRIQSCEVKPTPGPRVLKRG